MRLVLSLVASLAVAAPVLGQPKLPNLPPDLMAPTDPLSPADERKQFTLPAGFDAQLVASEPDIQKPMQMAFDAKGRLWVTTSYHYPFAAEGKPTDKVFVLSDFDPQTGKARKVQKFAEDLNIPIGVLPLPDCASVIVSSVGEIRKYKIADGPNGPKSDGFEVLFKGFGVRDTHGMYNSYTLMPDGWIYSCHGFANDSTVTDRSGNTVKMQSGHTFRFKSDGSRIEVWTRGQVNPFGMTVDPWFNLYTADCHSKPITQLIPGAYYDSFGKPHDGLGFAPHVTSHSHNSTGLCGLAWYDANQFPKDYLGTMFVGNVVTNRINFDRIEWKGATPVAKELPDFLVSKDRWFRPVDIKLGPDGALYVADFYNKIIGHYEVDLKDPRRDKDRGRIWRIVWKGEDGKVPAPKFHRADFTAATDAELIDDLFHPNLTVRFLAGHQLRSRAVAGKNPLAKTADAFTNVLNTPERASSYIGWLAFIDLAGPKPTPARYFETFVKYAQEPKNVVKPEHLGGHLLRALSAREKWGDEERKLFLDFLKVLDSVHQKRAAVEAVIAHPHAEFVQPMIDTLKTCAPDDTHLRQAAKIALRNCLMAAPGNLAKLIGTDEKTDLLLAEALLGARTASGASKLVAIVQARDLPAPLLAAAAEFVGRYGEFADREALTSKFRLTRGDTVQHADLLVLVFRGVQAKGAKLLADEAWFVLRDSVEVFTAVADVLAADKEPSAAELNRVQAVLRVVSAIPTVADMAAVNKAKRDEVSGALVRLAQSKRAPADLRAACAEAHLIVDPRGGYVEFRKLLTAADTPAEVRERLLVRAAGSSVTDAMLDARDAMKEQPYRVVVPIATNLASTAIGADLLLIAVKEGKAPQRLLQEKAILERLRGSNAPDWQKRVNDLTKNLPPADQRIVNLIKTRSAGFASAKIDKTEGAKLFTKHCAACHRIGDQGGKIAPQLDGVGVRGVERLLEDILDPNRNVDQAFRARSITLTTDKTLTALMLRVEGEVLVVADLEGKEQRIPLKEIATNRETMLSAMPANFGDTVPEAELYQIVGYLLEQKAKEPPKK
jgi:putative heme-binding domain-containing protein